MTNASRSSAEPPDRELIEPVEPADPVEPAESADEAEPAGQAEPVGEAEPAELVEPAGEEEPVERVSDAGVDDAEVVEAELVEPEHDEAAFGTGARKGPGGAARAPAEPGATEDDEPRGDSGGGDTLLEEAAAAVQVDLEELLKEREQFLGAYQRTHADFENFRKQAQKRQDDAVQRALGRFVEGLLPVLDACDAAVAHGEGEAVEPIVGALYGALEKEGLERIQPAGEPFDPTEAEAVMHEPGDGGEQVVAQVMRTGYRWRGRVLRPAMVKVTD